MYARLENGCLIRAPHKLDIGDSHVYNPNDTQLRTAGYKPVETTDSPGEPPEGWEYVPGWEDQGETIVQTWALHELSPEEPDSEEILNILLGGNNE